MEVCINIFKKFHFFILFLCYSFYISVKPGDPQPDIKFPEISVPKNFDEFLGMVTSVGKSAKDAIMPPLTSEKTEGTKKE